MIQEVSVLYFNLGARRRVASDALQELTRLICPRFESLEGREKERITVHELLSMQRETSRDMKLARTKVLNNGKLSTGR